MYFVFHWMYRISSNQAHTVSKLWRVRRWSVAEQQRDIAETTEKFDHHPNSGLAYGQLDAFALAVVDSPLTTFTHSHATAPDSYAHQCLLSGSGSIDAFAATRLPAMYMQYASNVCAILDSICNMRRANYAFARNRSGSWIMIDILLTMFYLDQLGQLG